MSKNSLKKTSNINRLKHSQRLRLSVFKSNKNIFAQIIDDVNNKTLVSYNSLKIEKGTKSEQSALVGENLAKLAIKAKLNRIYLDRGKTRYTGRLLKLCESARKNGLIF
mgnify:CR=1 FL=1|tara:strand:+ start:326 stop:652 length:327 start_codon:yes stop_codon:yes gene_type:complete